MSTISLVHNKFLTEVKKENNDTMPCGPVLFGRWVVHTSKETEGWNNITKLVRDLFDSISEIATHWNASWVQERLATIKSFCSLCGKATLLPFLLSATDSLFFGKSSATWLGVAKKVSLFVLAATLVGHLVLGITALATPMIVATFLNCTVSMVVELDRWQQMQGLTPKDVSGDSLTADKAQIINQERKAQMVKTAKAIISLAAEAFAELFPAWLVVNATVGFVTSLLPMVVDCYRKTILEHHLKFTS